MLHFPIEANTCAEQKSNKLNILQREGSSSKKFYVPDGATVYRALIKAMFIVYVVMIVTFCKRKLNVKR